MIPDLPVLLVDDDPDALKALVRALSRASWKVVALADPREALRHLETQEFAAVISDYRMPALDGVQLLAKVRKEWPDTERILLTAGADEEALERGINEAGISRLLRKPWHPEPMFALVDHIVAQSRMRREHAVLVEQVRQRNDELSYLNRLLADRVAESDRSLVRFRRRWDVALNAISDPITIVGEDMRIEGGNAAAGKLAGMPSDQLEGQKCHQALFSSSTPCRGCPLENGYGRIERKVGDHVGVYEARAYPLPGVPLAQLCVYRDITAELAFAREAAHVEKMAAIGRLAGSVAHELNNPLHAIVTFAHLAQKPDVSGTKLSRYLEVIRESSIRCSDIIQSLRLHSRRDTSLQKGTAALTALADKAIELFKAMQGKRIERTGVAGGASVRVNANQIQQVLVNLLQNAVDASPENGLIRVGIEEDGKAWVVAVEDQGPGVSIEERDKIFEPFYTTKPEGVGTGLGLSISDQIVRDHGGSLRVERAALGGARFEMRLPRQEGDASEQPIKS